jgi:molybdopterin-guanine dinucleotide biosynthesis protein A
VILKEIAKPVLNGLVLAGGKSSRMGFDKSSVNWHGKEQKYHMAGMLKTLCNEVFISCREDYQNTDSIYPTIKDTFTGLGPYGAILSASKEKPDWAWLVVACDLPLLDLNTLQFLVNNRNPDKLATAFGNGFKGLPEPLIAIWEPKSYPVLLSFLEQGYSCPRKVLINTDSHLIDAPDTNVLTNMNTPEDFEKVKAILQTKTLA